MLTNRPQGTAPVPDFIETKRIKAAQVKARKPIDPSKPKKANIEAYVKKLNKQIEGLAILESIIESIAKSGVSALDASLIRKYLEEADKLNDNYLPGAQVALRRFLLECNVALDDKEAMFNLATNQLGILQSLVNRGREYLNARIADPKSPKETTSAIEEWLGYAWKYDELAELGMVLKDVKLVQLSFTSYLDDARSEKIDEGFWIELGSKTIFRTVTYRPLKALKYVKEEDTIFDLYSIPELITYPGGANKRVRWENFSSAHILPEHILSIRDSASRDYTELVKLAKDQFKSPIGEQFYTALVKVSDILYLDDALHIVDEKGTKLMLSEGSYSSRTVPVLHMLDKSKILESAMCVRLEINASGDSIIAKPLALITESEIIRLLY